LASFGLFSPLFTSFHLFPYLFISFHLFSALSCTIGRTALRGILPVSVLRIHFPTLSSLWNTDLTITILPGLPIFICFFYVESSVEVSLVAGMFKGTVSRVFSSGFFHGSVPPQPQSIPLGPQILSKIHGDIR